MRRNQWIHIVLPLCCLLLASCNSHGWKVQCELKGLGMQNVRVVYTTHEGVKDRWIAAKDDRFEVEGSTDDGSLVAVYSGQMHLLAHLVVQPGDKVKVSGSIDAPLALQVKGNKTSQRWYEFIGKHLKEYKNGDQNAIDKAIEAYAKEHPKDMTSTVLLLMDYGKLASDFTATEKLINSLDEDARPAWLMATFNQLSEALRKTATRLNPMMLFGDSGDFESLSPRNAKATVLYLWSSSQTDRNGWIALLKELSTPDAQTQIADLCLEPDSVSWRNLLKADSTAFKHFWVPEGVVNADLMRLNIDRVPTLIVTDSIGNITYRGNKPAEAVAAVRKLTP